jgi:hypothetical protein
MKQKRGFIIFFELHEMEWNSGLVPSNCCLRSVTHYVVALKIQPTEREDGSSADTETEYKQQVAEIIPKETKGL